MLRVGDGRGGAQARWSTVEVRVFWAIMTVRDVRRGADLETRFRVWSLCCGGWQSLAAAPKPNGPSGGCKAKGKVEERKMGNSTGK